MPISMKTSKAGRDFIRRHEGVVYRVYTDPVGIKTAGAGSTGAEINALPVGTKVTKAQVEKWFEEDVAEAEAIVNRVVNVQLTQDMFDATVSFAFNVGGGRRGGKDGFATLKSGRPSTFLTKINRSDFVGAANELDKWASAKGQKLNGLVRRRAEEKALFLRGLDFEDQKLDSNIQADEQEKPKALVKEPAIQGAGAITAAALISEQSDRVGALIPYSNVMLYIFIGLVILGLIYQLRKS